MEYARWLPEDVLLFDLAELYGGAKIVTLRHLGFRNLDLLDAGRTATFQCGIMLHWLAGARPPDGAQDPDATGSIEYPDTPAPVFAVRAFKHAIFGTPQPTQPRPRRNSATENAGGGARNTDGRSMRPRLDRPKSANDANAFAMRNAPELPGSPTKGILMTPGTAAAKKKVVTFGDHVVDNEEKRPMRNGLPDDCPGKFPSPWNKVDAEVKESGSIEKGRGRNKLTEALEQARDESRKRKVKQDVRGKGVEEDINVPAEFVDPKSEAGKYWKREYDVYRTNTLREVKKLITKQRAAKSFAQQKDSQCVELENELRQEQSRVEQLEANKDELVTQMKELKEQLIASQQEGQKYREELDLLKRQFGRRDSTRPDSSDSMQGAQNEGLDLEQRFSAPSTKSAGRASQQTLEVRGGATDPEKLKAPSQADPQPSQRPPQARNRTHSGSANPRTFAVPDSVRKTFDPEHVDVLSNLEVMDDAVQRPSEPYKPLSRAVRSQIRESEVAGSRKASQTDSLKVEPDDDIWAQSFGSVRVEAMQSASEGQKEPRQGLRGQTDAVADSEMQDPALKTLHVNSIADGRRSKGEREAMAPKVCETGRQSRPHHDRRACKPQQASREPHQTLDLHPSGRVPLSSTDAGPKSAIAANGGRLSTTQDPSLPLPMSSPFQPDAKGSSLRTPTLASPSHRLPAPPSSPKFAPSDPAPAKENISPRSQPPVLQVKPSVLWSSTNPSNQPAFNAGKRATSMVGKDGKEVGLDRLEAARARIAARGRIVS